MATHSSDTDHVAARQPSETAMSAAEFLAAWREGIEAAEAVLAAPPPQVEGVPPIAAFEEWIDYATSAETWVQHTPSIRQEFWQDAKQCASRLIELARQGEGAAALTPELADRFEKAFSKLVRFGGFYSINYTPLPKYEDGERIPKFDLSPEEKEAALDAILDGWDVGDDGTQRVPGVCSLLIEEPSFARRGLTSLSQYFTHIDYYLETRKRGVKAHRPFYLGPPETEPSVLADDVWVKYMIRYHKQDVTIRDMALGMLRRVGAFARNGDGERTCREFWPLRGVSFRADPGDVVGIIGQNGSGKTTLLKTLSGILGADRGRVVVRGKVGCLLSFGVGFNQNLSGKENVYLNGSILGLSEREIDERFDRIVELCELGEFINAPVRTYSAGMRGRLGFSIAIHIDPDVLILDEVLTVGDEYFREKSGSIVDLLRSENKTIIIASHSMDLVRKVCTKACWLDQGSIRLEGTPSDVTKAYVEFSRRERAGAKK